MKKRIGIILLAAFLWGNWGYQVSAMEGNVEKAELCDGEELEENKVVPGQDSQLEQEPEPEQEEEVEPETGLEQETEPEPEPEIELEVCTDMLLKAGEPAVYEVKVRNTGMTEVRNLLLRNAFSCPRITWKWQPSPDLSVQGQEAVLPLLLPEQEAVFYVTAQLIPEQSGTLTHTATAETGGNIREEASFTSEIDPLRADFQVEKIADCARAEAGGEISYQICIRNTGELTLHSIVTAERLQKEGIKARFLPKEGIQLNEGRDKAFIPVLEPGESIVLQAVVKLPENAPSGELINEVTVLTQETGEKVMASRAAVEVEGKEELPVIYEEGTVRPEGNTEVQTPKPIPKTEDPMKPGEKTVSLLLSAGLLVMLLGVRKGKRKH